MRQLLLCGLPMSYTGDLLSGVIGTMTAWSNMQNTAHCDTNSNDTTSVDKSSSLAAKNAEKQKVHTLTHTHTASYC
jgi:hypothetical protein